MRSTAIQKTVDLGPGVKLKAFEMCRSELKPKVPHQGFLHSSGVPGGSEHTSQLSHILVENACF